MWIILGFRESSRDAPPEPFFAGIFPFKDDACATCAQLNKEKEDINDSIFYEVKTVQPNTVYDYEWNVMDEADYKQNK